MLKVKDEDATETGTPRSRRPSIAIALDKSKESEPPFPSDLLVPRRSIEREPAFVLEGSLADSLDSKGFRRDSSTIDNTEDSLDSSKFRQRSNTLESTSENQLVLEVPSNLDTFRLPNLDNSVSRTWNDEFNEDFVKVNNFLTDTLRTDSGIGEGETVESDYDSDESDR